MGSQCLASILVRFLSFRQASRAGGHLVDDLLGKLGRDIALIDFLFVGDGTRLVPAFGARPSAFADAMTDSSRPPMRQKPGYKPGYKSGHNRRLAQADGGEPSPTGEPLSLPYSIPFSTH